MALQRGDVVGRLTLTKPTKKGPYPAWYCRCSCGARVVVQAASLRGNTRSCGCLQRDTAAQLVRERNYRHGEAAASAHGPTPEYRAFHHAKARCSNPNEEFYYRYGARGIEFRFSSFKQFLAEVGRRPASDYSLDRINNNGHYEPGNVRWADGHTQAVNRGYAYGE